MNDTINNLINKLKSRIRDCQSVKIIIKNEII
jgi:hypothetical protein